MNSPTLVSAAPGRWCGPLGSGKNPPAVKTAPWRRETLVQITGTGWRLDLDEVVRLRCPSMDHGLLLGDCLAGVLRDSLQGPSLVPGGPTPLLMNPQGELAQEAVNALEVWSELLLSVKEPNHNER